MTDKFKKFKVSIDYSHTTVYENHSLEIEVKEGLLDEGGQLTKDAVLDWLQFAGVESIGNSWQPEDGDLSFNVVEGD